MRGEVNITGTVLLARSPGLVLNDETYLFVSWKKWQGKVSFLMPSGDLGRAVYLEK